MRIIWTALTILWGVAVLGPVALAQDFVPYHEDPTPTYGPVYNGDTNCYDDRAGIASFCPHANNNGGVNNRPVPTVDPCFIAQNAMRPCIKTPVGVDPKTVGLWKLQFKGGPWVWEIDRNGTYKFHSEANDGVAPHAGKFAAGNGRWLLKATNGYADEGPYRFQGGDLWLVTGKAGTAPWRLASAKPVAAKPTPPAPLMPLRTPPANSRGR